MGRMLVFGWLLMVNPVFGQNQWVVDSSLISFQIRNAGIVVNGTFSGLDAQIDFNPRKIKKSKITAAVNASTVDTGIRLRNKHLQKSDFFHVQTYPQITLASENFQRQDQNRFLGIFTLELKGKKDHVSIPFTFQQQGPYAIIEGTFELDRTNYDIGENSVLLSNDVNVNIWIKAKEE